MTAPAAVSASLLSLVFFARLSGIVVAVLVLFWALGFKSSFTPRSNSSPEGLVYAVLHPLLMVIGFIIISGEAILVHSWMHGSRNMKKSVHLCLQGVALASGVFGIWTKFHGKRGIVGNFYSLHSWMGLICVCLFGAQWVWGFLSFWHHGEVRSTRVQSCHGTFFSVSTHMGWRWPPRNRALEKLTFLQTRRIVSRHSSESTVVNGLGLGLALLSGIVILAAISPKHNAPSDKIKYSDTKCLSS